MSERLTREGLTVYFAQSDTNNDGIVNWDIDTLVHLILTIVHQEVAVKDAEIERLRDTLLHLYDAQNGPPLHTKRDIEFWEEAMSKARNLLPDAEGGEE